MFSNLDRSGSSLSSHMLLSHRSVRYPLGRFPNLSPKPIGTLITKLRASRIEGYLGELIFLRQLALSGSINGSFPTRIACRAFIRLVGKLRVYESRTPSFFRRTIWTFNNYLSRPDFLNSCSICSAIPRRNCCGARWEVLLEHISNNITLRFYITLEKTFQLEPSSKWNVTGEFGIISTGSAAQARNRGAARE